MLDVALIVLFIAFFILADLYVAGCRRIVDRGSSEGPDQGEQDR